MFGIVARPRCRHACANADVFGAMYCGLATELATSYGPPARLIAGHDATALALLGAALRREEPVRAGRACCVPLRRRSMVVDDAVLRYAADVSVAALEARLEDELLDARGSRRLLARWSRWWARGSFSAARRRLVASGLDVDAVRSALAQQPAVEGEVRAGHAAPETALAPTARAYGLIAAHVGAGAVGSSLGALAVLRDAALDRDADARRGTFNVVAEAERLEPGGGVRLLSRLGEQHLGALVSAVGALPLHRYRELLGWLFGSGVRENVAPLGMAAGPVVASPGRVEAPERKQKRRCCNGDNCCSCGDGCDCCCHCGRPARAARCCDCDGDGCCCDCDCGPCDCNPCDCS